MSASEKLKTLTIPLRTDDDDQWELAMADFAERMAQAFPQIVAVVEAAEKRAAECEECGGTGWDLERADGGYRRVGCHGCTAERNALAALDEALS